MMLNKLIETSLFVLLLDYDFRSGHWILVLVKYESFDSDMRL